MNIQTTKNALQDIACDALVLGIARAKAEQGNVDSSYKGLVLPHAISTIDHILENLITQMSADGEFKGNLGELTTIHTMGKLAAKRLLLVGLGTPDTITPQTIRRTTAIAARHLQQTGAHHIALAMFPEPANVAAELVAQAEVEGAILGLYAFRKYQHTTTSTNGSSIDSIQLVTSNEHMSTFTEAIHRGSALAEAANFARDLVNEPPNVLTPTELANRASAMAKQNGLECEILDRPQMQELGMGGLLGVAQGSAEPPKFIILRYRGAGNSTDKGMALVGKGITFDTGGISIKPAANMDEMKGDMAGAAAVIGAMQAIAALKPAINVTALVSSTENMPSGTAYRPGDILRISNGKTIEIVNTDAEGRLVLADALSYAVKQGMSPIIDVATLTGGIVIALGHTMTGMFCNNPQLSTEIIAAGQTAGEKFWPMPLDAEYAEQIKSEVADIKQTGGRPASAVTAAKILENFVGNAAWAHLDIAGTSYVDSKKSYQEKGSTGVAVRTLAELAVRLAK